MLCRLKNISINYEILGEGKPVVILHGYYPDHRLMLGCMEPVFRNLENYKRIYIDLPGMGKSDSAEWIINSDCMLNILTEFIEKIIPDEKFLLIGESYGGYLSRGLIYKMADKIDGVLLICPVIIADPKERNVPEHVVLVKDDNLLSKLTLEEMKDFNSMSVVQNEKNYERYRNEIIAGVQLAQTSFLDRLQQNGYKFSFDVDKESDKFDKPTLIILGKQDSCVGYKDAWDILENYPRATFALLDKAGHNLQIEQEQLFNSLVNEWLVRVEEF